MKLLFRFLPALVYLGGITVSVAAETQTTTLKVMTYNVQHLVDSEGHVGAKKTADIIHETTPDVVMLQELDSVVGRSGHIYELGELARLTGLNGTYASAIPLENGSYGVGMLTVDKPLSILRIPLPGVEPRVLLIVETDRYVAACTHLDLEEENRLKSVAVIAEALSQYDKPTILAGDWNDTPDKPLLKKLHEFLKINSAPDFTYPSDKPAYCIDYIATMDKLPATTVSSYVIDNYGASDHRPVVVTMTFGK